MKTIDLMHDERERMLRGVEQNASVERSARRLADPAVTPRPSFKELAMYVIAGVSGNTGSVAASTLLAAKQPVRVIVRDAAKGEEWKARGAEVAVARLEDRAALARALTGAKGAYLLLPPNGWTDTSIAAVRKPFIDALVGAVSDARPGHVVLLSSIGANHASGTGPIQYIHPVEQGLRASGVPSTFLRAGFFVENWLAMAQGAIDAGTLYYGMRNDVPFAQVATTDIGRTAARLLAEGTPGGVRVVQLAGPVDVTVQDVAATIGKIAGKTIGAVTVPREATVAALTGMGASKDIAEMYAELTIAFNDGLLTWEHPEITRGTVTLEQRLRELLKK
jgi:uncharacterized protein YbjT (DUF2867 family)